jgi:hypothetical protein
VVTERAQVSVTLLSRIQVRDANFGQDTGYRGFLQTLQENEGSYLNWGAIDFNSSITPHYHQETQ